MKIKRADGGRIPDFDDLWEEKIRNSDMISNLADEYERAIRESCRGRKSEEEMHEMALEEARKDALDRYDEISDTIWSLSDEVTVYREICVENPIDFIENINDETEMGVFWAVDAEHAISYWPGKGNGIVLVARVDSSYVDIEETVLSFIDSEEEYEIRLEGGAPIFIEKAIIRKGCGEQSNKRDIETVDINKEATT